MPAHFTKAFAERLNGLSQMEVREARDGEVLTPGLALVAPGNKHMLVHRASDKFVAQVKDGPSVHHQRPSVDVLFNSVAKYVGAAAVGVLLTGMGADGAAGLLAMCQAGARTIAQDEETSVVYGMPKEAANLGAAQTVLPLGEIAAGIVKSFNAMEGATSAAP